MKSLQGLLLALVVVLGLVVAALCGDHDHFGRHQKGGHRFHGHHKHHPQGAVKLHLHEQGTATNETVVIDVTRSQNGVDGSQSKLRVNLRIHIIQGNVHINGKKIDHALVTAVHLRTNLDEVLSNGKVQKKKALVTVRVMVVEAISPAGLKQLSIQEEIIEIDGESVSQIEVKEVVLELADKLNESKRTITVVKISESKIHKKERRGDKHLWACKGRLPKDPFNASKDEMAQWRRMHKNRKPPHFEIGGNDDGDDSDDDDRKDGNNVGDKDRQHGGKHHHKHRYWGRRFCRWFYKLPVGTRAIFCISVILVGVVLVASCCVCICKKPKRQPAALQKKYEMSDTGSEVVHMEEEASPLPMKKSLDKQPLIA